MRSNSLFGRMVVASVAGMLLLACLNACTGRPSVGEGDAVLTMPDRFPRRHIEKNFHDCLHALHVVIEETKIDEEKSIRSDDGNIGYLALQFDSRIVHSYKGGRPQGDTISFSVVWEYYDGLLDDLKKDSHRIVFINKGHDGSYIGMAFGVFLFAEDLDKSLKAYAKQQAEKAQETRS